MISPNPPNICYQTWYSDALSWAEVSCKKIGLLFSRSRSWQGLIWSDFNSSTIYSEFLILLQTNLVWKYIAISQSALWRNWIVVFKIKVTAKFVNVSECLSRWYHPNRWTFYCQTWYGDASLWARLSSKKIGLLSSRSRPQWRII